MKNLSKDQIITSLGILGLVILGVSLAFFLVQNLFPTWLKITMGIGTVLCLVYAGYYWDKIKDAIFNKQVFRGTNTGVFIIILIAILSLVNYLGSRHHKRIDLTKNKKYSLSDQSKKLIDQFKEPIDIKVFYRGTNFNQQNVMNLLNEYKSYSKNIKVEHIDPDLYPGKAQEYNAQDGNSIIFYEGRRETVTGYDEKDFSGALLKLLNKETKKIYFLTGHGEHGINDYESVGYNQIKQYLEQENYIVDELSFSTQSTLPKDMAVLVIAGPDKELFPGEIALINQYLKSGGKAFIMVNPPESASLQDLLKPWGIQADANVIIDPYSTLISGDVLVPVIDQYPYNDITRGLERTVFPYAQSLSLDTHLPSNVEMETILETSQYSWGKGDLTSKSANFDPQKDKKGPLPIGITYKSKPDESSSMDTTQSLPETRMVVIGNANFAGNEPIRLANNRDLFLNCINWLSGDTDLLGIRAKEPDMNEITLFGYQGRLVAFTALLFIPGIIILCGILVWVRRR